MFRTSFIAAVTTLILASGADDAAAQAGRSHGATITVKNSGLYVARFYAEWSEGGKDRKQWDSGDLTAGTSKQVTIPGNATYVKVSGDILTGLVWQRGLISKRKGWKSVGSWGTTAFRHGGGCFVTGGTLGNETWTAPSC